MAGFTSSESSEVIRLLTGVFAFAFDEDADALAEGFDAALAGAAAGLALAFAGGGEADSESMIRDTAVFFYHISYHIIMLES